MKLSSRIYYATQRDTSIHFEISECKGIQTAGSKFLYGKCQADCGVFRCGQNTTVQVNVRKCKLCTGPVGVHRGWHTRKQGDPEATPDVHIDWWPGCLCLKLFTLSRTSPTQNCKLTSKFQALSFRTWNSLPRVKKHYFRLLPFTAEYVGEVETADRIGRRWTITNVDSHLWDHRQWLKNMDAHWLHISFHLTSIVWDYTWLPLQRYN